MEIQNNQYATDLARRISDATVTSGGNTAARCRQIAYKAIAEAVNGMSVDRYEGMIQGTIPLGVIVEKTKRFDTLGDLRVNVPKNVTKTIPVYLRGNEIVADQERANTVVSPMPRPRRMLDQWIYNFNIQ